MMIRLNILSDALVSSGNVNFTILNPSGSETMRADVDIFAGAGTNGLVPDPGTETGLFLKDDGTWGAPSGGGMVSGISKNSGSNVNAANRSVLNFIEGTGITLTITDDAGGDEVDITIASTSGGGSGNSDLVVTNVDLTVTSPHVAVETANRTDIIVITAFDGGDDVTLPASPTTGHVFHIKDDTGTAAGGKRVNILGNGNNIDGSSTQDLKTNYENMTIVFNGTQWNRI